MAAGAYLQQQPQPRFDAAIKTMHTAFPFSKWQFGVRSQIDNQIGVCYYLQQDFSKALPHLQKSLGFGHWMGAAMLGVIYYRKKNFEEMEKTFDEIVLKKGKKQPLVWCLYAYLLSQNKKTDKAQSVLNQGLKKTENDQRVKDSLLALQNNKKIKMRAFKEQWYQFHLERPPSQYAQRPVGQGRMSKSMQRGSGSFTSISLQASSIRSREKETLKKHRSVCVY